MNKIVKNINKKKVLVFFVFLISVLLLVVFLNNSAQTKKGVDPDEIKLIETFDEGTGMNGTGTEEAEIHYVN